MDDRQQTERWLDMLEILRMRVESREIHEAEQQAGVLHRELVEASLREQHPEWFQKV